MEAAVLNRATMPQADCNSNTVNAELEVKKLQQLVRKLERQNAQLRTRAGPPGGYRDPGGYRLHSPPPSSGSLSPPEEPFDYFQPHAGGDGAAVEAEEEEEDSSEPSVLDELELLDFDRLRCADESDETWLYVSSKAREPRDGSLTPLQWCRRGLRCPESEVEAARRSLSLRLEQVSRWRSALSSPFPTASPVPPLRQVAGVSPISSSPSSKPCSTPWPSERHAPSFSSPLQPGLHRALSPVGKCLPPVSERTPAFVPAYRSVRRSALSAQASVDGDLGASGLEDDSVALGYKLQDLTDVQVMARLQEESLRQDYACTSSLLANRRSQSFTFQLSAGRDQEEEDEDDDEDYGLLPPPQPRLTHLPQCRTFSSIRDWRRSTGSLSTPPSIPCTPPSPSIGFAFQPQLQTPGPGPGPGPGLGSPCAAEQHGFRPGSAKLRRSMPNLVRAPSMPCVPSPTPPSASPSLLRNSQSFDSCGALARLHSSIPSPGQLQHRVHSVGNFPSLSRRPVKATAYVSPTIKGSASTPAPASPDCFGLGGSGIPMLSKAPCGGGAPASAPNNAPRSGLPRSGLPRPASLVGPQSSTPRGKLGQPPRSFLTPPKSFSTLSALRDSSWRDGCY